MYITHTNNFYSITVLSPIMAYVIVSYVVSNKRFLFDASSKVSGDAKCYECVTSNTSVVIMVINWYEPDDKQDMHA